MANLDLRYLSGYVYDQAREGMGIQFHLTTKCDQKCAHCYMYESDSYQTQLNNTMDKDTVFALLEEIRQFSLNFNLQCTLAITGGDPILSPYFWDVLEFIKNAQLLSVIIMGNSYHINDIVAKRLKKLEVISYQISLDGLRDTHDETRKAGSFDDALRALEILHTNGITTNVMFTVFESNYKEVIPLYNYLDTLPYIDSFCFDKMVPIGNAQKTTNCISKEEYHELLFNFYKELTLNEHRVGFSMKDNLWKLFLHDMGLTDPFIESDSICTGCVAGSCSVSILSDGEIYACRRLELPIGKYPEQKFQDIVIKNPITKKIRDISNYSECNKCDLRSYCRGCLAIRYAFNGDIFSKDPYCWRER